MYTYGIYLGITKRQTGCVSTTASNTESSIIHFFSCSTNVQIVVDHDKVHCLLMGGADSQKHGCENGFKSSEGYEHSSTDWPVYCGVRGPHAQAGGRQ